MVADVTRHGAKKVESKITSKITVISMLYVTIFRQKINSDIQIIYSPIISTNSRKPHDQKAMMVIIVRLYCRGNTMS